MTKLRRVAYFLKKNYRSAGKEEKRGRGGEERGADKIREQERYEGRLTGTKIKNKIVKTEGTQTSKLEGKNSLTRVVFSTLHSRGKSLTPASSIAMLDPRIAVLERRDETQDARG